MENIQKKEIPEKKAIRAFINGFISYGIIFGFISFIVILFFYTVTKNISINKDFKFTIATSCIRAIIIYFLILFICRISTFDVLKKSKLKTDKINYISKQMGIFFILCSLVSIMFSYLNLSVKNLNITADLYKISTYNYESFKNDDISIATALTDNYIEKSKTDLLNYKISLGITELSIFISCIYLIKYQKKMILLYNKE